MSDEIGQRTDEQIAALVYGDQPAAEELPQDPEVEILPEEPKERLPARTLDEIAENVYPPTNPKYADVDSQGNVSAVIREIGSGRILAQSRYGTEAELVGRSSPLPHADLSGIKLAGKSLDHGNFHDGSLEGCNCKGMTATWADLRRINAKGTSLKSVNFGFSDLRGMVVDEKTDISKANFTGAAIDQETYSALIKCRGAASAKGLGVRDMPTKKG